ncbi:MAG: molybdopterin-dependent oxidoreductase [Candidatus Dormibacteraeota bacterium]|nr:molybdopterin-dependent oxidoreductase [Candidatus Dormibacteraeota bacterium]
MPVTRPFLRRPPVRLLVAGLAAGAIFDALNLLLRFALGVPSLPEAMSDLLVPFVPAALFGKLLTSLGPSGKQIVIAASLLGIALGIAVSVVLYDRFRRRFGTLAATAGLLVAGWLLLSAIFWTVLGANDHGGSLLGRYSLALADLALCATAAAATALVLVGAGAGAARDDGTAPADPGRRGLSGGMAAAVALLAIGGTGVVAGVRQLLKLSNLGYEGYGTPASALGPITPNPNFYVVSKNLLDPTVDAATWQLVIDGAVDRVRTLTLADLHALPQVDSVVTLECIANGVGGALMSTARWQGPTLVDVLATAGIRGNPSHAELHAVDGYYDSVRVDEMSTPGAVLALRMNSVALPDRHGYPARVVLPGRYGEKQMKWITRIRLTNDPATGFYQRQGWSEMGTVRTWSRFDNLKDHLRLPAGRDVMVTGHAFAGTRGIDAVQVSVDKGVSWADAEMEAVIGRNAWRYFHWTWRDPAAGVHELAVRARDGAGDWQEPSYEDIVPKGSSGLHRVKILVG